MTTDYSHGKFGTFSCFIYCKAPLIDVCIVFKTSHQQLRSYGDWATALVPSNRLAKSRIQPATSGLSVTPRQLIYVLGDVKVDPVKYKRNYKQAITGEFG